MKVVREMFDLLAHHDADAVKAVAVGDSTAEMHRVAQDKPIELIHSEALLAAVRAGQAKRRRRRHGRCCGHASSSISIQSSLSDMRRRYGQSLESSKERYLLGLDEISCLPGR
ncbi:MAG: hypothetical protein ABI227_08380 [Rhodanobacter sp.]